MKSDIIRGAAALLLALALSPAAAQTAETPDGAVAVPPERVDAPAKIDAHPFAAIAGNWTGGGVIMLTNDIKENLRCRANHSFAQASSSLSLSIKCSSDNYRFELTSNVVERRGQISGKWSEASYNVSGSINGRVAGNRITAVAQGDKLHQPDHVDHDRQPANGVAHAGDEPTSSVSRSRLTGRRRRPPQRRGVNPLSQSAGRGGRPIRSTSRRRAASAPCRWRRARTTASPR